MKKCTRVNFTHNFFSYETLINADLSLREHNQKMRALATRERQGLISTTRLRIHVLDD